MKNIGVIDSGVGGLTVLFDVLKEYPNCNYYYIGDSKNCPYGEKTVEELKEYSYKMVKYLVDNHHIDILIIACNSISSTSAQYLKDNFKDIFIIETIVPTSNYSKRYTKNNKIGIIATNVTIHSNAYQNNLCGYEVFTKGAPEFVKIVEDGIITKKEEKFVLSELENILENNIDTLILGCTHFPLLVPTIRKVFGGTIIISNKAILEELDKVLKHQNMVGDSIIYTTGNKMKVKNQIRNIFRRVEEVQTINI